MAGLRALKCPCQVEVQTASDYIWDLGGRLLRPRSSDLFIGAVSRGTAKNGDLWREFDELSKTHGISITWGTATDLRGRREAAHYWAIHGRRLGQEPRSLQPSESCILQTEI